MSETIKYRYIRGVLDGMEGEHKGSASTMRQEIIQPLICKMHKDGNLSYPFTNDYAIYRLIEPLPGEFIYLFYGVKHQERPHVVLVEEYWVSIDRGHVNEAKD